MAAYSVFEPPLRKHETAADPDRFRFVRDGFSWGAFLLGPLWMLWRRLWLVLVIYLVGTAALQFGLAKLGVSVNAMTLVAFLIALLLGFEGATLVRWTLSRQGWKDLGTVVGKNRETAERRFFDRWVAGEIVRHEPPPARPAGAMPRSYTPDVVGLFPEPGGSR